MIINIRGTSGSGKSTLVRELMSAMKDLKPVHGKQFTIDDPKERLLGYVGHLTPKSAVCTVGSYETDCGGCDTIKTQDEVCARVNHFSTRGHVVFEGLLISHIYGRYKSLAMTFLHPERTSVPKMEAVLGRPSRPARPSFMFAFLDTPLEVCIERVKERRLRKGNTKELDTTNTVQKWHDSRRVFAKAEADGLNPIWLPWENPLAPILELLT